MSTTLQIILGEAFLLIFVLAIVLSFINWKKKKQQHAELDALLDQISGAESDRKSHIAGYLVTRYKIEASDAALLSEDFIAAEKNFLYEYLEQQFQQKTSAAFYANTCKLLDKYLDLLPDTAFQDSENEQNNEELKDVGAERSGDAAVPDADLQQAVDEFQEIQTEEPEASVDETTQTVSRAIATSDNAGQNEPQDDFSITDDKENLEGPAEGKEQQRKDAQETDSDEADSESNSEKK